MIFRVYFVANHLFGGNILDFSYKISSLEPQEGDYI